MKVMGTFVSVVNERGEDGEPTGAVQLLIRGPEVREDGSYRPLDPDVDFEVWVIDAPDWLMDKAE